MQPPSKQDAGFLRSLFDFSFTYYVTTKIIKTLYVIITIAYSLIALALFIAFLAHGGAWVVIAIIGVPIAYILYLALARVSLEVIAVVFRIAEYARDIRDGLRLQYPAPPGWSPAAPPQPPFTGPAGPPPMPPSAP